MGLGTGRRGMKSPPLLIAVLLACVFVLGINYWITSSKCVELQNRVMELEGRMRRAAAERGAVELKKNEYEDMLAKQKRQIDTIQTLHSGQMNNVRLLCDSEKEQLMNNITGKDNVLQTLQVQMSNAHKRLEEFKEEFKELEETQAKKLSYELAQCSNKIAEVKEQCEERLWKTGSKNLNDETEKSPPKMEIVKPTPYIKEILPQSEAKEQVKPKRIITADLSPQVKEDDKQGVSPINKEDTNKLELAVQEKKPSAAPQQPKQKVMENEDYEKEPANEVNPANVNAAEEDDEIKAEDVADKDAKETEEVERENLMNLEGLQEEVKGAKQNEQEEDADYNGDDANEAEPETDKQAQLIDNDQNLKEDKVQNGLNGQTQDQETEDEEPGVK